MPDVDPLAPVLTTVNAPYRDQPGATELAACLADFELSKRHSGHISSFLSGVKCSTPLVPSPSPISIKEKNSAQAGEFAILVMIAWASASLRQCTMSR